MRNGESKQIHTSESGLALLAMLDGIIYIVVCRSQRSSDIDIVEGGPSVRPEGVPF
jgi:hypothetical protein